MTKIKRYVILIDDELEDAKMYAEKALEYKAKMDQQNYSIFKKMSEDELDHAMHLHTIATKEIEELSRVYKPTAEMQQKWDEAHVEYVEKTAWIKQMLAM